MKVRARLEVAKFQLRGMCRGPAIYHIVPCGKLSRRLFHRFFLFVLKAVKLVNIHAYESDL